MEEAKKVLDYLCDRFGINNEVVIACSEYVDILVAEEQIKRLRELNKN